jgi:RNA polymerase sigma-70 factor (ECF subfamily)
LSALEAIGDDPRVFEYQPYWAAKADLFARAGHTADAAQAYRMAIGLEKDPAVRRFLQQRLGTFPA